MISANKYTYEWRTKDKRYKLTLYPGDTSKILSTDWVEFELPKGSVKLGTLKADFDDDVPVGLEKIKSFEIEFDIDLIESVTDVNFDATKLVDAIIKGSNTNTDTFEIETGFNIPFNYENRIIIEEFNGDVIFHGIQEINEDNNFDRFYKAEFSCIGAKTLIAVRPIFEELGLSFSNIVSNNWTAEHNLYPNRSFSSSTNHAFVFNEDNNFVKYKTYVSKSLLEIHNAFQSAVRKVCKEYMRDVGTTSALLDKWYNHFALYKEETDVTKLTESEIRLICLEGVNQVYKESGETYYNKGLLSVGSNSWFKKFDNLFELYKHLTADYLSKARFDYSATIGFHLRIKPILGSFESEKQLTSLQDARVSMFAGSGKLNSTKIKQTTTSVEPDGRKKEFSIINNGVKSSYTAEQSLSVSNALAEVISWSDKPPKIEINGIERRLRFLETPATKRFYSVVEFFSRPDKLSLQAVSAKTQITYDDTFGIITLTPPIGYAEQKNQESGLHTAINQATNTVFSKNKQSYIEIVTDVDNLSIINLGNRIKFNNLANIVKSNSLATRMNNEFVVVNIEWRTDSNNVKLGLYGVGE